MGPQQHQGYYENISQEIEFIRGEIQRIEKTITRLAVLITEHDLTICKGGAGECHFIARSSGYTATTDVHWSAKDA